LDQAPRKSAIKQSRKPSVNPDGNVEIIASRKNSAVRSDFISL
jgi:hypothetical protein